MADPVLRRQGLWTNVLAELEILRRKPTGAVAAETGRVPEHYYSVLLFSIGFREVGYM